VGQVPDLPASRFTERYGARYTSRQPPVGSATPMIVPINAPNGVPTSFPRGVVPSTHFPVHRASATVPRIRPAAAPMPSPINVFRSLCAVFFTETRETAARGSRSSLPATVMTRASSPAALNCPRTRLLSVVLASISVPTAIAGAQSCAGCPHNKALNKTAAQQSLIVIDEWYHENPDGLRGARLQACRIDIRVDVSFRGPGNKAGTRHNGKMTHYTRSLGLEDTDG
jgi:hypothetical protein